ncbi:MAG: RagB/SusD family nutrient uptake outer membrane protein [Paludibacter sp.]
MKKHIIHLILISFCINVGFILNSCTDNLLEQAPISDITPEMYFNDDAQVSSYVINCYSMIPSGDRGTEDVGDYDNTTDNQGSIYFASKMLRFTPTQFKVADIGGDWDFNEIYKCNYFFQQVLPKWKAGKIGGSQINTQHYIGEMYFLRAYAYFKKLQKLGDFPIVKTLLPDDQKILIEASKRSPRNEVARFILADLDSAKLLLQTVAPDGNKNRISKLSAQLFSSRVALFEGTWEKYFKGTAFVPNGTGWPGKDKEYNVNYEFPSGSIDGEIAFFLGKAMEDAKAVAEGVSLTTNTYLLQQDASEAINPYYDMFAQTDMSKYNEVLLWRKYDNGLGITNGKNEELQNGRINITRGLVDCFLMANGLPIYASGSGYHGDDSIPAVKQERDNRLFLFLKEPGQLNVLYPTVAKTSTVPVELISPIVAMLPRTQNSATGYDIRKGINFNAATCLDNSHGSVGIIIFRAAEAYLNYIEASYEKNGNLDGDADKYWKAIRTRAGVDPDYSKTISSTDVSKEAPNDWGAYSGGNLVNATLYNIRRERRCELMAEGLRDNDILRWRAMDQMITTPYHIEGFKLWGPVIQYKYVNAQNNKTYLKPNNNVSDKSKSIYLRPYEVKTSSIVYDGLTWKMAHYLNPIAVKHFMITSVDGADVSTSPIYQNPGWPIVASQNAQ